MNRFAIFNLVVIMMFLSYPSIFGNIFFIFGKSLVLAFCSAANSYCSAVNGFLIARCNVQKMTIQYNAL